jgi:hypothetical protein
MGQIGQNLGTVGLDEVLSFDGVRDTVEAIVTQLAGAWEKVRPSVASIEFGLSLTAKCLEQNNLVDR